MGLPIIPPQLGREPQPVLQPNLDFIDEQEHVITELYSLAWSVRRNTPDWYRMSFILDEELDIAARIDAQNQREQQEVNPPPIPAPAPPQQD